MPTEALKNEFRQQFTSKVCLHPEAGPKHCNAIIDAHTVQRARTLQKLLDTKNHVMTFYPPEWDANELLRVHKKGWKLASTFTGFCRNHDAKTFAPLENKPFEFSTEAAFLLSYRALCHELFQKHGAARSNLALRQKIDKGQPTDVQREHQRKFVLMHAGITKAIKDLRETKTHADRALLTKNYEDWGFACLEFSGPLSLATTGAPTPNVDFNGQHLQTLHDQGTPIQHLYLSIVSRPTGAAVVFGWRKDHAAPRRMVESLLAISQPLLSTYIVQFVFAHIENVYFSSSWWGALDSVSQLHLRRLAGIASPYYSQPIYVENEFVAWKFEALHNSKEAQFNDQAKLSCCVSR